jgi:Zn-finger nucleic acid-binding protein
MTVPCYTSVDADGIAKTEADHHMRCPGCGLWFDMGDLSQVFEHLHGQDIEINELPKQQPH